ncbi:MAG TPA: hypothetical protein VIG24_12475 [Acidimicrobiia bacterium]
MTVQKITEEPVPAFPVVTPTLRPTLQFSGFLRALTAAVNAFIDTFNSEGVTSDGTTGGTGSAGAGNQYVEMTINGTTYKVLHDGSP